MNIVAYSGTYNVHHVLLEHCILIAITYPVVDTIAGYSISTSTEIRCKFLGNGMLITL